LEKSSLSKIDAIIFDIGGVFVKHDNALLFQRLAEHCRSPHASAPAIRDAVVNSGLRTGEQSVPEFHATLVRNFGFEGDYDTFAALWVRGIHPIPEMLTLVRQLHGYSLFILSDTNEEHWKHVATHYLDPTLFEDVFLSHRLGIVKPDPRLFEHVLAKIACPPAHAIFVDDTPENVMVARTFGMNAYLYTSAFDFGAELARLAAHGDHLKARSANSLLSSARQAPCGISSVSPTP
jgi:HAD superfamily hydrolase (TIGR01509 family)